MARAVKRGDMIVLEMSEDEATAIFTITGSVCVAGQRADMDRVYYALQAAGVKYLPYASMAGALTFKNKEKKP